MMVLLHHGVVGSILSAFGKSGCDSCCFVLILSAIFHLVDSFLTYYFVVFWGLFA